MAELSLYCTSLRRQLTARAEASNKRAADAAASLSLVRQLYHLKVIPPYEDPKERRKRRLDAELLVGLILL